MSNLRKYKCKKISFRKKAVGGALFGLLSSDVRSNGIVISVVVTSK
nr:MAG TPA: hypothetical protein [Caudoviricetes sp.]